MGYYYFPSADNLVNGIDLINLITSNGADLDKMIVGDTMDPGRRALFDSNFGTFVTANSSHRNHIHVRFTADPNGLSDLLRFTVISNTQLAYVAGNSVASTHTVDFQLFDRNNNPLLPWTPLRYQPASTTVARVTGRNLVNNVPYNPGRIWINISNQASRNGVGSVQVECLAVGVVNITLNDSDGNNVGTITAQCQ